ncbi:MAG: NCS2 family permease [Bacteroidales bacterium]|nr:NCS2 family permease [Bacteroidales bacterium]
MIEKIFHLRDKNTTIRTETVAGITTFMTMAYILAVNPQILSETGMDRGAVFTATVLASVIAIFLMAFYANLPIALAPGMGLNAFFAYTVVINMGYSWEMALTAVFIEGIIFILLSFFKVREAIVNSIPINLKHAISVGIGLFIALIGLSNAGIITGNPSTLVSLGNLSDPAVLMALSGIVLIGVLLVLKIRGALIIGIIIVTLAGIPLGITQIPEQGIVAAPPSLSPVFFQFDFHKIFEPEMLIVVFTFLFVDIFDTVGTLVGVCSKAGLLDSGGNVPRVRRALLADAVGTTCGAIFGTSTITSYIESAAGISAGGKTGLTALVVALLFIAALFLSPVFLMIPSSATTPALIIVGLFMISPVKNINLGDYSESIPVFLTIIMMPLAYSISEGIVFGIFSFVLLKLFTGHRKEISVVMYILCILFILRHLLL